LDLLERFTDANYRQVGDEILGFIRQIGIRVADVPSDVLVVERGPRARVSTSVSNILLVMGPGIGIGDEITFFGLPRMLKQVFRSPRIQVVSTYRGLWDCVRGVDTTLYYDENLDTPFRLFALPSADIPSSFDLVFFIDFDHPNLYYCFFDHPQVSLFAEIALASYSAALVDNPARKLYRLRNHYHHCNNTYLGLDRLLESLLGIRSSWPSFDRLEDTGCSRSRLPFRILVNPFSTKANPNVETWMQLITGLALLARCDFPMKFVVNTGLDDGAEAFVLDLVRACADHLPQWASVEPLLKPGCTGPDRFLLLPDMLKETAICHAVMGTDSFTAHMAPLFDCLSLVIGDPVHLPWHVPHERCFYLNQHAPVSETVEGMQLILSSIRDAILGSGHDNSRHWTDSAAQLNALTTQLGRCFVEPDRLSEADLLSAFQVLAETRDAFVSMAMRTPALSKLMVDRHYPTTVRFTLDDSANEEADRRVYLEARWEEWNNSNLRKYIALLNRHSSA